jgi:alcohol dehydrogenase YqhD (iron-dependent ADH family)
MQDFMIWVPTQIFFGKNSLDYLAGSIKKYGDRVLLVYGGGSIKKIGLYDKVVKILNDNDIFFVEHSGVSANPKVSHMREGIKVARENNINVVLPVGGGSVIDEAKGIAGSLYSDKDPWDLAVEGKRLTHKIPPILTILTLAATGTEMSTGCVWVNDTIDVPVKKSFNGDDLRPKVSFLNPEFTYSVNKFQTGAGTCDIMSHVIESYFSNCEGAYLQARTAEAIMKTLVKYGPIAVNDPQNYEARANLMYSSSWGNNGLVVKGNLVSWSVHAMEHELSAYLGTTHGEGLAILTPNWMRWVLRKDKSKIFRFVEFGINVFGVDSDLSEDSIAEKSIESLEKFFYVDLGMRSKLRDIGVTEDMLEDFADRVATPGRLKYFENAYLPMSREDILEIYKASL